MLLNRNRRKPKLGRIVTQRVPDIPSGMALIRSTYVERGKGFIVDSAQMPSFQWLAIAPPDIVYHETVNQKNIIIHPDDVKDLPHRDETFYLPYQWRVRVITS